MGAEPRQGQGLRSIGLPKGSYGVSSGVVNLISTASVKQNFQYILAEEVPAELFGFLEGLFRASCALARLPPFR